MSREYDDPVAKAFVENARNMVKSRPVAEAFVEINHPNIAVRLRRPDVAYEWHALILSDAGLLAGHPVADPVLRESSIVEHTSCTVTRPRMSSDGGTWIAAYFEVHNAKHADRLADIIKSELVKLGYTLTKERFPV
jgi:hypothetical protein